MHEHDDIDPESNLFHNVTSNCCYYIETQFTEKFNVENSLSIIHFNRRSLNANFQKIKDQKTPTATYHAF